MTVALNGVTTTDNYPQSNTGGCQIPPVNLGEQVDLVVGNAAAVIRLFRPDPYLGPKGGSELTEEFVVVAGSGQIQNASYRGANGFQARSFIPGTPATIYAIVWEKGDPVPLGGTSYGGTLTASGSNPPPPNQSVIVQHNGVVVGTESTLNLVDEFGFDWSVANDAGNNRVNAGLLGLTTPAILAASGGFPGDTTSLTYVMYGLSRQFTPQVSGNMLIHGFATFDSGPATSQMAFGTGAPPAFGSAPAGLGLGIANCPSGFLNVDYITGLTLGVTYWIDFLLVSGDGGAHGINRSTVTVQEIR